MGLTGPNSVLNFILELSHGQNFDYFLVYFYSINNSLGEGVIVWIVPQNELESDQYYYMVLSERHDRMSANVRIRWLQS